MWTLSVTPQGLLQYLSLRTLPDTCLRLTNVSWPLIKKPTNFPMKSWAEIMLGKSMCYSQTSEAKKPMKACLGPCFCSVPKSVPLGPERGSLWQGPKLVSDAECGTWRPEPAEEGPT